jgi:hypothetical protein
MLQMLVLHLNIAMHSVPHEAFLSRAVPRCVHGSSAILSLYGQGFSPLRELHAKLNTFQPNGQMATQPVSLWIVNDTTIHVNITVPMRTVSQVATLKLRLGVQEGQLAATAFTILLLPSSPKGPLRLNLGAGTDLIPQW